MGTESASNLPAFSARDFRITGGSFKRARAGGAEETYEIVDVYGLQGIGSSSYLLSQSYKLVNDIDASGTVHWNDGKGFKPIGSGGYYNEFSGSLNGQKFRRQRAAHQQRRRPARRAVRIHRL